MIRNTCHEREASHGTKPPNTTPTNVTPQILEPPVGSRSGPAPPRWGREGRNLKLTRYTDSQAGALPDNDFVL